MNLTLRDATAADAGVIARLHIASWRAAYRGILPDAYLDGPVEAERSAHWRDALARRQPGDFVLLLHAPTLFQGGPSQVGEPAGFLAARIPGGEGYGAYIDNLHVRPDLRGGGLGLVLLAVGAARMAAAGAGDAFLWLFDGNAQAGRFYARLGGIAADRGLDEFAGARIPHTRIIFRDLAGLAEHCRAAFRELHGADLRSLFR